MQTPSNRIDRISSQILEALQQDARLSNQQLADQVGLSATPVWRRVRELEEAGVIRRYVALLDREKLGLSICVLAYITLARQSLSSAEDFEVMVKNSPQITECLAVTGECDYVIKVLARDIKDYNQFLNDKLFKNPSILHVRSNVMLHEVKYETALSV